MDRVRKNTLGSYTIKAPVEDVFTYIEDPMNLLGWMTSVKEIKGGSASGAGRRFYWTCRIVERLLEGEAIVTDYKQNDRIRIKFEGDVTGVLDFGFKHDKGYTRITIVSGYSVSDQLGGEKAEELLRSLSEKGLGSNFSTIKEMLEDKSPPNLVQ